MTVLNLRDIAGDTSPAALLERGIVRVDRATAWGNPFRITRTQDRADVIARYRRHLWRRIRSGELPLDELAAIAGLDHACHCAPLPCHADVLARAAAWAARELATRAGNRQPESPGRDQWPDDGTAAQADPAVPAVQSPAGRSIRA